MRSFLFCTLLAGAACKDSGVGDWAPLLREGLLFGSYEDHHAREVGLKHTVETFRFVRTAPPMQSLSFSGVATIGSSSGRDVSGSSSYTVGFSMPSGVSALCEPGSKYREEVPGGQSSRK